MGVFERNGTTWVEIPIVGLGTSFTNTDGEPEAYRECRRCNRAR